MAGAIPLIITETEEKLAEFYSKEASLLFSSGFLAAMSVTPPLVSKGDYIIADQWCHSSLRCGFRLSGANVLYFKHNNFKDADKMFRKCRKAKKILVMESVYSADGDIGNLKEARILCDK